jgi:DAACS family dicarboxylate/amino acid:cation (Na+ or H+) symporter
MQLSPLKWSRPTLILGGLVFGALIGLAVHASVSTTEAEDRLAWWLSQVIQPLGKLFIRIIFMVVIPLIFSAIVLGVAEMGDLRKLGRVGIKCIGATVLLSGIGVAIALAVANLFSPGERISPDTRAALIAEYRADAAGKIAIGEAKSPPVAETLLNLVPQNPLAEAVNAFTPNYTGGGLIAVMVFSLFFGIALAMLPSERGAPLLGMLRAVFDVCLQIIEFAMKLAPLGVACLGFALTASLGLGLVTTLGAYMGVVLLGLALHQFVSYPIFVATLGRRSPLEFFRQSREAIVTAFVTSSSNATLPVSLRVAEQNLRIPARISRFVLTVGASANQNGTALYEGVTVLFLAQVFGVDLSLSQQLVVALMCVMAGLGTAGVPGGSLPLVVGVLVTIGVPGEAIAIILGIDRILDMCRTALNVTGDLVIATIVSRGEETDSLAPGAVTPEAG